MSEKRRPSPPAFDRDRRGSDADGAQAPDSPRGPLRSSGLQDVQDIPGPLDPMDATASIAPERLREMARTSLVDAEELAGGREPLDSDWDAEPTTVIQSPLDFDEPATLHATEEPARDEAPRTPDVENAAAPPDPAKVAAPPPVPSQPVADNPRLPRPRGGSKTLLGVGAIQLPRPISVDRDSAPKGLPARTTSTPLETDDPKAPIDVVPLSPAPAPSVDPAVARVLPPLAPSPTRPGGASGTPAAPPAQAAEDTSPRARQQMPASALGAAPGPALPSRRESFAPIPPAPPKTAAVMRRGPSRLGLVLAIVLPLAAGVGAGLLFFRSTNPQTNSKSSTESVEPTSKSPPAMPASTRATQGDDGPPPASAPRFEARRGTTVVDRAREGDPDALGTLERKPPGERSLAESVALAEGRVAGKRREFEDLRAELLKDSALLEDRGVLDKLRGFIHDRDTAIRALATIAEVPGEIGPDILYDVWIGTRDRNETTWLAEQLVYSESVLEKASKPLQVALALRAAERNCEATRDLLSRAAEYGDQRSARPLQKLLIKRGCGDKGFDDCYGCLRSLDRDPKALGVRQALSFARGRRAPKMR
jgi:hypothetical protein